MTDEDRAITDEDRAITDSPKQTKSPRWRGRTAAAAAAVLLAAGAVVGFAVIRHGGGTTDQVAGISLDHPADWARQGAQDAATFSPLNLAGQAPGATQEGWNQIIATLGSDPSTIVGVYVRESDEPDWQSKNLETLKTALAGSLTGSRISLQAPDNADQQVAGKPAITLEGDIRPWGSTDSLRIRSYIVPLDNTTGRSVYIMFFAAPSIFEASQDAFTKVLETVTAQG